MATVPVVPTFTGQRVVPRTLTTIRSSLSGVDMHAPGLVLTGIGETNENIRDWGNLALYITAFTSEKIARRVLASAKRIVPYDTGDLYDSGYVARADGVSETLGVTVVSENVEGTESALITDIQASFPRVGYFGGGIRTYNKWVAGFSAEHAAVVHENPKGYQWHPPPISRSGKRMPSDDPKQTHFLLVAFNKHKAEYSAAMIANLAALAAKFRARETGQAIAEGTAFGTSGVGRNMAPRINRTPR